VAEVDPDDVTALLDRSSAVEQAVPVITVMARAYTRGNGFDDGEPNDEIAAVITLAAARLAANTAQLPTDTAAGPFSQTKASVAHSEAGQWQSRPC
jgi:hypothetical protein